MATARCTYTVGAMLRTQFRRGLMSHGLDYKEDKSLLNSYFVVSGPLDTMQKFHTKVVQWMKDID